MAEHGGDDGADARPSSMAELRARIEAVPVEGDPDEKRAAFRRLCGPCPAIVRETIGGCPAGIVGEGPRDVVWLHGGGYVFGAPETHAVAALYLAEALGARVVLPDYPLAPEHPWPAQREAVGGLLDALGGRPALVGDSAGGHLALSLALARPGGVGRLALISPNTDRTGLSETRGSGRDLMNDDATDAALARLAFGREPARVAEASPLHADLSRLPPLWLTAGSDEVLLDDALLLARRAALAGVAVEATVREELFHLWPLWPDAIDEARATLEDMARFLAA
ncbi:MAG: alpha/beta hydrolase [Paracoccaceae bacterium]